MRLIVFFIVGIVFGIIMTKSEAISWYRIQEMFRFQSFHMYGIIGSALVFGSIFTQLIKKFKLKDVGGNPIVIADKAKVWKRYLFGGTIFGMGWAFTGACPGPMYTLVGTGYLVFLIVIISAILGTFVYGLLRDNLPH